MTASSFDPTTGAPQFADGDAPDVAENANEVADFAASVGTRLIGTTAERTDYDYAREGLRWWDTDLDAEYLHTGSGWILWEHGWKTYTPSATNASGGTITGRYKYHHGVVDVEIRHVFAGAGISGQPSYTLPVDAVSTDLEQLKGDVWFRDASGGAEIGGFVRKPASVVNAVQPYVWSASLSFVQFANVSSSSPFSWAASDVIDMKFSYRAA